MASKTAAADPAPRAILLQCGAMPNYSVVNESKEEFSSLQERIERWVLLHQPQPTQLQLQLQEKDLSEQAVLLHSIFCKFCHPKPSVASVLDILLLERQRVLIVNNNNNNGNNKDNDDGNDEASTAHLAASRNILQILAQDDDYNQHLPMSTMHYPSLPKEVLIHTSPNAAESIISILTCSAKSCLLKLPVHFQLAFWRILVRLLSDETDDEFDTECLFQFKDDADINHHEGRGGGEEQMNDGNGCYSESGERKRDDNQNIINDESHVRISAACTICTNI